jgi:LEA14-like dessication related protein
MKIVIALMVAACLAGCAALAPKLEAPDLSIVNVELMDSTLLEQRMRVRMRVQNPNDRSLPVRGLSYTLEVDGQELAQGVSDNSFNVPAFGETEFDMTLRTNMALTLLRVLGKGGSTNTDAIGYLIRGRVSLSEGFVRSIPFEHRGVFNLK